MACSVLQTGATPSFEQLEQAFDQTPGLTAADARMLGRDAYGILLLEIFSHGASQRHTLTADRPESLLLFQCLGERRSREPLQNLSLFVQDLARFAPAAPLSYGAHRLCQGDASFVYATKTAFYREITWLLWRISAEGRQLK